MSQPHYIGGRLLRNLVTLLLLAVALSAYLLHYTDWFETVGGLLALGGAFSWFAFLSRLLPADVLEQLQEKSVAILKSKWTSRIIIGLAGVFLALSFSLGSVRVELRQDGFSHYAYIYRDGETTDAVEPDSLKPGAETHLVRWAAPFTGSKARIKLPGLASQPIAFIPWRLTAIYVPHSFTRKVYLLMPSPAIMPYAPSGINLNIAIGTRKSDTLQFFGTPYWINCTDDVEVPLVKQNQFLSEVNSTDSRPIFSPKSLWGDLDVTRGEHLKVSQAPIEGKIFLGCIDRTVAPEKSNDTAVEFLVLKCLSPTCESQPESNARSLPCAP